MRLVTLASKMTHCFAHSAIGGGYRNELLCLGGRETYTRVSDIHTLQNLSTTCLYQMGVIDPPVSITEKNSVVDADSMEGHTPQFL